VRATPGNIVVELLGHRWDGAALEVPLHALDVYVSHFTPDLFGVDRKIKDHKDDEQTRYRVGSSRCGNRECKLRDRLYAVAVPAEGDHA